MRGVPRRPLIDTIGGLSIRLPRLETVAQRCLSAASRGRAEGNGGSKRWATRDGGFHEQTSQMEDLNGIKIP